MACCNGQTVHLYMYCNECVEVDRYIIMSL